MSLKRILVSSLIGFAIIFLFCGLIGEIVLLLLGKVDGDGIYW